MRTRRAVLTQVLTIVLVGLLLGPAAVGHAQEAGPPSSEPADVGVPGPSCVRVPQFGYLPPGRSASTEIEFSSFWAWSASSAHQPFHWQLRSYPYLGDLSGHIVHQGDSRGEGGSLQVAPGLYRWEVTNKGTVGQAWTVCWR